MTKSNDMANDGLDIGMSSTIGLALCCALGLLLLLPSVRRASGPLTYPNGPKPLPLLGNIISLRSLYANLDRGLLDLKNKWGDVCMLWYGSSPVLLINSPKAAREFLNEVLPESMS